MSDEASVRVRILQLGRRVIDHTGRPGLTVGSTIEAVGITAAEGMDLRVNGAPAEDATPLRNGDVVTIIPRIKGG